MSFVGYIYGKFSSDNRLEIVDIYFNGIDLRRKLLCTFGSSIYRPMTLANDIIVGEPSSFAGVSQVVTILPDPMAFESIDNVATVGNRPTYSYTLNKLTNALSHIPSHLPSNILSHMPYHFFTTSSSPK